MFNQFQIASEIALVLSEIQKTAKLKHAHDRYDDYCPADNGNFDDAFEDGENYGRIEFARELWAILSRPK